MTTENTGDGPAMVAEKTSKENRSSNTNSSGSAESHVAPMNGVVNGHGDKLAPSKEHRSDKDKHREKDKHKEKSRDKDKERSKDKHSSSSSGKDKVKSHSSSSSSSKDKEKDKDKKPRDEKKEREHKSSSSKDKEHKSSSSSSKDKERHSSSGVAKDKDKHSSSSSHRDKDKSLVSSSRDKTLVSSSKDKHVSSSSSKDKDKTKHSSDRKSSSSSDKHKSSKDKSKHDDRHKEKKREEKEKPAKEEVKVKSEPIAVVDDEEVIKPRPSIIQPESRVKIEDDSDEDVPLAQRIDPVKRELDYSEDDMPLSARKKVKKEPAKKRKAVVSDDESDEDMKPAKKKTKKPVRKGAPPTPVASPKKKKKEEEAEVWKWWEEEKKVDGAKWRFLEHLGPMFAPPYERLPANVKFSYNGKVMKLSEEAEEMATFYAKMLEHDYTTKEVFNKNFFQDWRKTMNKEELETIKDLSKCNFKPMNTYFLEQTEIRKAMSKEEKKAIKEKNEAIQAEYGFCTFDGHKEKIGNFRIEPPGLFRGRGEHPKMGMHKKRVMPENVIINCSAKSKIPRPPAGHKWKEVRHDDKVTWLASWTENVQGQVKYVMLNPSSKLKGEKDWQKYEVARDLKKYIGKIRTQYQSDWKAKEMMMRQRSVALYFIDKLALRAGNEKDEDQADTVGCCSLRVEHISLEEELNGKENVVVFDFLGKDSIRYYNEVSVERRVFKNLQLFMQNKSKGDDLFDRLNTTIMNKHLGELMPGLSAKVFRTYNASITLQDQLDQLTEEDMSVQEKILAYNRANRAVAILCNHQRAVPKTHEKSMGNMKDKIEAKKVAVEEAERAFKQAKQERGGSARNNIECDKRKKAVERLKEQLAKLSLQATDKEENKDIALGTSKLNYLDPRISVAWCKKNDVPIDKIYNKTQRSKFNWAIDMATPDFVF